MLIGFSVNASFLRESVLYDPASTWQIGTGHNAKDRDKIGGPYADRAPVFWSNCQAGHECRRVVLGPLHIQPPWWGLWSGLGDATGSLELHYQSMAISWMKHHSSNYLRFWLKLHFLHEGFHKPASPGIKKQHWEQYSTPVSPQKITWQIPEPSWFFCRK